MPSARPPAVTAGQVTASSPMEANIIMPPDTQVPTRTDRDSGDGAGKRQAAIIGRDGRASTSKAQVALWTAAVVWALVDLLLLARAYPGGKLFTSAVTANWRPEYLVLLGLPVAAATMAKVAVASSNSGHGPVASSSSQAMTAERSLGRVYVRNPIPMGVWGFVAGVAELLTDDDGTIAWADLLWSIRVRVRSFLWACAACAPALERCVKAAKARKRRRPDRDRRGPGRWRAGRIAELKTAVTARALIDKAVGLRGSRNWRALEAKVS